MSFTLKLGTADVRFQADGPCMCRRVYFHRRKRVRVETCGHRHRSTKTARRCAYSMGQGWISTVPLCESWVEVVRWRKQRAAKSNGGG